MSYRVLIERFKTMLLYNFMAYGIFKVDQKHASEIENLKKDDLIGRQSIWTRDAASLGAEGYNLFVKIEGDEKAIQKERPNRLKEDNIKDNTNRKLKQELKH